MQTSRGKLPQPDSPELDKILERVESNYIPIYEHPPSYGIQPITIQNREQAIQAIQEYYTNKFLEIVGERPEMQEGFEFPCRFCGFDPDKLLKRIKLL